MFWKISLTCYNLCVDTWKPCSRKDIHTYHTTTVSSSLSSHCLAHVQLFMAFNAKTTLNFFCFVFSFFFNRFKCFSPFRQGTYCKNSTHFNITNIKLYHGNYTTEVFETSQSTNCTKAVFKGSRENLCKFTVFCMS